MPRGGARPSRPRNKVQLRGPTSGLIYVLVYVLRLGPSALQGLDCSFNVTLISCRCARRTFDAQTGLVQTSCCVTVDLQQDYPCWDCVEAWILSLTTCSTVCVFFFVSVSFCLLTWLGNKHSTGVHKSLLVLQNSTERCTSSRYHPRSYNATIAVTSSHTMTGIFTPTSLPGNGSPVNDVGEEIELPFVADNSPMHRQVPGAELST